MTGNFSTQIECRFQHRPEKGYWLITLDVQTSFFVEAQKMWAHPQAHAIIDDYGTIQITSEFR